MKNMAIYHLRVEYKTDLSEDTFNVYTKTYNGAIQSLNELVGDIKNDFEETGEELIEEELTEDFYRCDGENGGYIIINLTKEIVEDR